MKQLIGIMQIFGGVWGVISFMNAFFLSGNLFLPFASLFFIFNIVAGVYLLKDREEGLTLSIIIQGLQLIGINALNIQYYVFSGVVFYLNFGMNSFSIHPKFGGGLILGLNKTSFITISFNVVAFIFILILIKLSRDFNNS